MPSAPPDRRNFFISFNCADRAWAEWIAYELEEAGYTTFFQHWDFSPGSNFVLEMHYAASQADKTIAVLSQEYLDAIFTQPEWSAALVQDPTGAERRLIPVRVQSCQPRGILAPIVYTDLVDLSEQKAREELLSLAQGGRAKPKRVSFPGGTTSPASKKEFPGARKSGPSAKKPHKETGGTNSRTGPPPNQPPENYPTSAWLPFVWFALALLGAVMIIAVGFGLVNQIYYVVLVALGLGAAGALFAGIRSNAKYHGQTQAWLLWPLRVIAILMIVAMALVMSLEAPRRQIGNWMEAWMGDINPIRPQAQRTMIDLDAKQVLRIGSRRFPASEPLRETNASAPVMVDTQPVVIKWNAPENRRIAVYTNEHPHRPEQEFPSGHEFGDLAPGRYYVKITYPRDRYTSVHLEVLSQAGPAR